MDRDAYLADVERWRQGRLRGLLGPRGWLAVIGLDWLSEGPNAVGSSPAGRVHLPEGKADALVGWIDLDVDEGRLVGRFVRGSGVTHEGAAVTTMELRDDRAGPATVLELGSLSFSVIHRVGRWAVRVRDQDSPARRGFPGIEHWPVDPRWRVEASLEPGPPGRTLAVPTMADADEEYEVPGTLRFEVGGVPCSLLALHEPGATDHLVVFADRTTGRETYGGGRFVYVSPPPEDGTTFVDFNRAYNPPCAFTPHATCPLPPDGNRLSLRVEAGEKRFVPTASGTGPT